MGNAAITIDDDYTFTPFGAKICMVGTDTFGNKVILQYENLDACSHVSSIGTFFIYVHAQEADNAYLRLFINDTVVDILDSVPDNSGNALDPIAVFVDSKTPLNFNTQLTLMNGFPFDTSDDSVNEIMNRFGFVHKGHTYAKNELSTTLDKIILYPDNMHGVAAYFKGDSPAIAMNRGYISDEFTILHEYGHHVFNSIYGNNANYKCPIPHYIYKSYNLGCAYHEGWADAFPFIVNNVPRMQQLGDEINIESRTFVKKSNIIFRHHINFEGGYEVEGNFAALLYDIHDTRNDALYGNNDYFNDKLVDMWNLIKNTKPTDHKDMANIWNGDISYGGYGSTNTKLDAIMKLNDIISRSPNRNDASIPHFYQRMNDLSKWTTFPQYAWITVDSFARSLNPICDDSQCNITLTDAIDLSQYENLKLSFRYIDYHFPSFSSYPNSLTVSTTSDGTTWTDTRHIFGSSVWTEWNYNIPDSHLTENFKIRFTFDERSSNIIHIASIADIAISDQTFPSRGSGGNGGGSGGNGGGSGDSGGGSGGIDTTEPTITINTPTSNQIITSDSVTVSGSASDTSGIKNITIIPPTGISVTVTGSTFSYTFTGLSSGSQTFMINAWDNALNLATDSVTVTIEPPPASDTTPPTIDIRRPNDGDIFTTDSVEFRGHIFEGDESGIFNIRITLDNAPLSDPIDYRIKGYNANPRSVLTDIPRGNHTITFYAENGDGYANSDSVYIIIDTPVPKRIDSFFDDAQTDMSKWILGANNDNEIYWKIKSPYITVPNSTSANSVFGSSNCDTTCTMKMVNYIDMTQMSSPNLGFLRFVDTPWLGTIPSEGIISYVSINNGNTWTLLENFTNGTLKDDGLWHKEEYDLSAYSSATQFKLRFDGISSSPSEYMELDDIKIYDKDTITIYETSDLTITSDNPNPSYAKAGDIITVTLWTNDIITNSYMQMLNRTIVPTIYNNTLVANLTIHDSDANGNPAFDIILVGINDNQTVSELNLTGSNIFIDTIKPNLTLNGTPIIHTELGHDYIDPGTTLHDNDPAYNGTVISNATALNTSALGTYLVEYSAPADFAGNKPENVTRAIIVSDMSAAYLTNLTIYSDNSNTARAKAGDTIQITLVYNKTIENITSLILGRSADFGISDNIVTATTTVLAKDSGNATFVISASDESGNILTVTHDDLNSTNVLIDNIAPILTLNGPALVELQLGEMYDDPGAIASDADPLYNPTVLSNYTNVNTSQNGTYFIEYTANTDPAGNEPKSIMRNITVHWTNLIPAIDNPIAVGTYRYIPWPYDPVYNIETINIGSNAYAITVNWYSNYVNIIDITNVNNPTLVSTMTDEYDNFIMLSGPRNVHTVEIDSSIFALITARNDDGMQIVNITDPANPIAVSSITDSTSTNPTPFEALNDAFDVDTVIIGTDTFAIIASEYDGMQIVNITDPATPVHISAIIGEKFYHVDTVTIGTDTFAMMLANNHNIGLKIINITDPVNPSVINSIRNNYYNGPYIIYEFNTNDIITTDSGVYSVISSSYADKVFILDITDPMTTSVIATLKDSTASNPSNFTSLNAPKGVDIIKIGQSAYALVASSGDRGIQIINITDPANPTATSTVRDNVDNVTSTYLATSVSAIEINSNVYSVIGSRREGIQIMDLGPSGIMSANAPPRTNNAISETLDDALDTKSVFGVYPTSMPDLTITSSNHAVEYASVNDMLTVQWIMNTSIVDASATIMGRTADVVFSNNVMQASTIIHKDDTGFAFFALTVMDSDDNILSATESDLNSTNIIIDTEPPRIQLEGNPTIRIQTGFDYVDAGAVLYENDPMYDGIIYSNASAVNTLKPGTYAVEYIASPDAAGNVPTSKIRTVIVHD